MAFVDELKAVLIVVGRTVREFFEFDSPRLNKYLKIAGLAALAMLAGAGVFMGYRYYVQTQEQKAHESFDEYMRAYQTALQADTKEDWNGLIARFAMYYSLHKDSKAAPLFLSLKADAHQRLGEKVEAIETLQQAIDGLPTDSPLAPLLKTKQALLQLDAEDDALSKVGLAQLVELARDKQSAFKDLALFYLGQYYWSHDQLEDAQKAWQELEDLNWSEQAYPSAWLAEVKQKLKQR